MGKLEGKVAFITGAARGQGRSHAIRLAQEGANIIAVDICEQIATVPYPMSTLGDLAETAKQVEALDRRIFTAQADVRDAAALKQAFDAGTAELGPVDIVLANAGIAPMSLHEEYGAWQDVVDVNLTGVFNTVETAIPSMIERGQGGAIVLTSSTAGINGIGGPSRGGLGYTAAKHGVVGLMRSYANNLAPHSIRVNSVHPTGVNTPMVVNEAMQEFLEHDPSLSNAMANALPVPTGGAGGHLQRDRLARLRRRPLRHRRHAAGRRRLHQQEVTGARTMPGRVAGKVAFITGAARGQGRSHAIRLAQEGADIIAVDIARGRARHPLRGRHRGRPRRDGQAGRGARPADRGRPRPTSATTRRSRRRSTTASPSWAGLTSSAPTPGIGSAPVKAWEIDDRPGRR